VHLSSELTGSAAASVAAHLRVEVDGAFADVLDYTGQIKLLLDLPVFDRAKLITVRLRLAQLRLVHGAVVNRVYRYLVANSDPAELEELETMRLGRQRLLQQAAAHAAEWTLATIADNWPKYQYNTRIIVRRWLDLMNAERRLLDRRLTPA